MQRALKPGANGSASAESDDVPLVGGGKPPGASEVAAHTARMLSTRLLSTTSSIPPAWRSVLARRGTTYSLSCLLYTLIGVLSFLQWWQCPQSIWWWPRSIAYPESFLVTAQARRRTRQTHRTRTATLHSFDRECGPTGRTWSMWA
jgi:hypothetical protein